MKLQTAGLRLRNSSLCLPSYGCSHKRIGVEAFRGLLAALLLSPWIAGAQPSGGPYGPIAQTYSPPANAAHTLYVAPDGLMDASGSSASQPTTLESALTRAVTGDAVILRGGTYRTGGLVFNQGITIQPYADEHPVLKGSLVATNWESLRDGVWRTSWKKLYPSKPADWWRREREGMRTPVYRFNNDMVFVDGRQLKAAGWEGELDENTFYIDYDAGQVYLRQNPRVHLVEITAFDSALVRTNGNCRGRASDRKGPTIRGIAFTQYAYRALEVLGKEPEGLADPSTYGKDVVGTTLENLTITHCSRVAGYFRGDNLVIRNCLISDTRTEGIYVISSADALLEKNIFMRNNIENITGYFPSAVKIFNQCYRATCRDNLVLDQPYSNGIWYDVGNVDGVFVNNWVEGAEDGFFFEISKNAICAGNVFFNCDKGVRALNSSNVKVYHNTFVNTVAAFERTERSAVNDHFGWHPSTGPDVDKREGHEFVGNLMVADATFQKPLVRFEQAKVLCAKLTKPQVARFDENVYLRSGDQLANESLMIWGPADGSDCQVELRSLEALKKLHPEFESHSRFLPHQFGSVLKSLPLQRYELVVDLSLSDSSSLPAPIDRLLGWTQAQALTPGAYPFVR